MEARTQIFTYEWYQPLAQGKVLQKPNPRDNLTITKGGFELLESASKNFDFSHHAYHLN